MENEERYQFTWPDKKKSVLLANAPINKTLRPVRDDETTPTGADSEGKPYCSSGSVDFDTTENLYIEGDNLEVLKLLQETYLGKVKMSTDRPSRTIQAMILFMKMISLRVQRSILIIVVNSMMMGIDL